MSSPDIKKITPVIIAIVLIAITFSFVAVKEKGKSKEFKKDIANIDYLISAGFYSGAEKELKTTAKNVKSSRAALCVLKRAEKLSEKRNDYAILEDYSKEFVKRFRNNIEINAVNSYAAYKNDNISEALNISEKKLAKSEYNTIYLLSVLKSGNGIADKKVFESIPEEYSLFFSNERISVEDLKKVSTEIKDDRLLLDTALLLSRNGELVEAAKWLGKMKKPDYEVAMLNAYDIEDYNLAKYYFNKNIIEDGDENNNLLFGADICIKNGNTEEAIDIYKRVIENDKEISYVPYRNLYSLTREYSIEAGKYLEKAKLYFPDEEEVIVPILWERSFGNDYDEELSSYSDSINNSTLYKLYEINENKSSRSPEYINGLYWNIINQNRTSSFAAVSFSNYLLKNSNIEQLEHLLEIYEKDKGNENWYCNYLAIMKCLQGKSSESEVIIDKAEYEDVVTLYNRGVIKMMNENYKESEKLFKKAEEKLENSDKNKFKIKIYYKLAELNYYKSRFDEAENYINKLLKIKNDDLRGNLMLKKIKEGYYD